MKFVTTMPHTTEEMQAVVMAACRIRCTPMESSCDRMGSYRHRIVLGFMANESNDEFERNKGYTIEFMADDTGSTDLYGSILYELGNFDVHPNEIWDKTIRTHEEMKNELDRLWESSTYDERFALRRLYEFMREPYPC